MKDTMKAVVLRGVGDLRLEELPVPRPRADHVLIKSSAVGVCGTDVHMWAGTNFEGTFPFIPGHEGVGEVVGLGPDVRSLRMGDRVVGEPFIPCGICAVCQDGGASAFCPNHEYYGFTWETSGCMAEYQVSPEVRLHKIPESMSDDEGAMVDPVSCSYHAIWGRGGGVAPHDRVAIFGAGPIGLFATQIAMVSGAQVMVVEPAAYRQEMARDLGVEEVIDPSGEGWMDRVMDLTGGQGLTLIVECSGNPDATASTVDVIGVDGRIVLTGQSIGTKIPIELGKTIWKHATVTSACDAPHFIPKTIAYLSRGLVDVGKVITHHFPLDEALAAFELGNKGTGSGKIVLDIWKS